MGFTRSRHVLVSLLLAGCTSFDQSDEGNSKAVLLGKTFTITLPAVTEPRAVQVENKTIVRFVEDHRDSPKGMDTFEFKAIGTGETEIHIPKMIGSAEGPDFVLTVKVVLGGSPY